MLHSMKRGLFVGTVVAVVAALCSTSALAARGHGKVGPRAAKGAGNFGPFVHVTGPNGDVVVGIRGFGGPGFGPFGGPVFGGPGFGPFGKHGHGPGMRGGSGGGLLAGAVLKTAATYLGMSVADLQAELKGGKTLAQVATSKSKTAAGLITALANDAKENLAAAVGAGWITQTQADAVLERVTDEITGLVNNGPPVPPEKTAKRAGPLDTAAAYLGTTVTDLVTALKGGKSLAQVAADKGKTVDGLVTALTAGAKTNLDKAVAAERITQAQANAILSKLTQQVTDFVNGVHGPKGKTTATTTANSLKVALKYTIRR
jgi:hypothetical protein